MGVREDKKQLDDRLRRALYNPPSYDARTCLTCGSEIAALPSRISWVFRMHVEKCTKASPEDRLVFRRTRK